MDTKPIEWIKSGKPQNSAKGIATEAFSLTKVLLLCGGLVAVLVPFMMTGIKDRTFSEWQITTMRIIQNHWKEYF